VIISPLPISVFARLLPDLPRPRQVVALSSSQITSQQTIAPLEESVRKYCKSAGVAWTILRPTMIYLPPLDHNVTALARIVRKFRFFPFWGRMSGLRQPVHAEDIATALARAMASERASGFTFDLPGGETLTFRTMVERIFRALGLPPILVPVPRVALDFALHAYLMARPSTVTDSGLPDGFVDRAIALMNRDMVFDAAPACAAFGFNARPFAPIFPKSF
jgi:nucleoside-diphosphate-sugar epimerase